MTMVVEYYIRLIRDASAVAAIRHYAGIESGLGLIIEGSFIL